MSGTCVQSPRTAQYNLAYPSKLDPKVSHVGAYLLHVEWEAAGLLPDIMRHLIADVDSVQGSTQEGVRLLRREGLHQEA